ncbi:22335_t:CDS:2, partial [Racocetra persica]
MSRGRTYPRCLLCGELLSKEGYRDGSIAQSMAESDPYHSDCKTKRDSKKEEIKEESREFYERAKKLAEEESKANLARRINEAFSCQGCGKFIELTDEAYAMESKSGYYCQNCIVSENKDKVKRRTPQITCSLCKKSIASDYYLVGEQPVCLSCQPRAKLNLQTANKILQGQVVDVESLDLPAEDKINLSAAQQIMQGQPVDIDNLSIEEDDKNFLKELQASVNKSGNDLPVPKPNSPQSQSPNKSNKLSSKDWEEIMAEENRTENKVPQIKLAILEPQITNCQATANPVALLLAYFNARSD